MSATKKKQLDTAELVEALLSLRDGQGDALGSLLGRTASALKRLEREKATLRCRIEMAVEERKAMRAGKLVVATMDSESKTWLAVGRTEEEAKAGIKAAWDKNVVPAGGEGWDKFSRGDPWEWYSGSFQHVVLGKGYVDGWDERNA